MDGAGPPSPPGWSGKPGAWEGHGRISVGQQVTAGLALAEPSGSECPGGASPSLPTHLLSGHSATSRAAEWPEGTGPWGPAAGCDRLRAQEPLPRCGGPSCPSSCELSQSTPALSARLSAAVEPRGVRATFGFRNEVRMSAGRSAWAAPTGLHPWNLGGDPGWTGASTQPRVGPDGARMRCRVLAGARDAEPPGVCAATVWRAACSTPGQN